MFVQGVQRKSTKNGSEYIDLSLRLQHGEELATINGNIWPKWLDQMRMVAVGDVLDIEADEEDVKKSNC